LQSVHPIAYHSAFKRSGTVIHATTRMNVECVILGEASQSQRTKMAWSHSHGALVQ
jgi:hypothetical protein